MANLGESATWEAGIYQLERTDIVDAGVGGAGAANLQPKQLANRTAWLKQKVDTLNNSLSASQGSPGLDFFSVNASAIASGRLTLSSGEHLPSSDRTGVNAATLYFTPYNGNTIGLWTGAVWGIWEFGELSLSLNGTNANTSYDIFLYNNGGTLTLERVAWTNDTTRAIALTTQNGVLVKSGDFTRRYLGTIRTVAAGQSEQSYGGTPVVGGSHPKWLVWNAQNREQITVSNIEDTTNWTYNGTTWRAKNNSSSNRISLVLGQRQSIFALSQIFSRIDTAGSGSGQVRYSGFGLDSTTAPVSSCIFGRAPSNVLNAYLLMQAQLTTRIAAGFHYLQELEINAVSDAGVTTTWSAKISEGTVSNAPIGGASLIFWA